jgi:hypothetical protein
MALDLMGDSAVSTQARQVKHRNHSGLAAMAGGGVLILKLGSLLIDY